MDNSFGSLIMGPTNSDTCYNVHNAQDEITISGDSHFERGRFFEGTGNRESVDTPRIEARRKSSSSLTQRIRASICPNVDLLKSKPDTWHLAANCSWVISSCFRKCRILGPTIFAGLFAFLVIINKFCLDPKRQPAS